MEKTNSIDIGDGREIVAEKFRSLGFQIHGLDKKPTANGVDLVATSNSECYTIEVKRATINGVTGFSVNEVSPPRKQDDFIAVVLSNGAVLIFDMEEHLKLCRKDGRRSITKLARLFGAKR